MPVTAGTGVNGLRRIYKEVRILEFMTFYQNALHLTRVYCATFYQSALRHKQFARGCIFLYRADSSEEKLVVMFRTDLPIQRFEGDA